jgi:hypothetical protein
MFEKLKDLIKEMKRNGEDKRLWAELPLDAQVARLRCIGFDLTLCVASLLLWCLVLSIILLIKFGGVV